MAVDADDFAAHRRKPPLDAIAVTGMSCLLPGAAEPAAFWSMLTGGHSAIGPPPETRELSPRHGGFLDRVDGFDADFFGISRREAEAMDPQQRIVLELSWSALEDAGIVPAALAGSRTGVFVGTMWDDYATLLDRGGAAAIGHHGLAGTRRAMIANRVSYVLGLRGPSLAVDTAQSSSLVAVHLAMRSIRAGEAELALVGGVNLDLVDSHRVAAERLGGVSPDGRCYVFDARANGYVPGEGGVVLVLRPLADAVAAGDRVYCVLLGSAVNNDGGGAGLTAPAGAAQEDVLRRAYADAGLDPKLVRYIELHGTGTPLGDPIEAAALGAVLGAGRAAPVRVGSVKTNVGHLEGAAGITGLLKVALSTHHATLPASLNFRTPNPAIPFAQLGIEMQADTGPWPPGPLFAGVSSFGIGGSNAHVVVSEAGQSQSVRGGTGTVWPWLLSARTPAALRDQADRLRTHLRDRPELEPGDVAYSLATTRTAFGHRAAVIGPDRDGFLAGLDALAADVPSGAVFHGTPTGGSVAFLFTGQGAQRVGMGMGLYQAFPAYAAAFDEVCAHLDQHLDRPLADVLGDADALIGTGYAQPALFAVEVALVRLLESFGVRPDLLLGHSIGELVAAHIAGVWSLADACRLVAARGRLMQALPPGGAMAAIEATEDELAPGLDIAAVNGPRSVVVSGAGDVVADAVRHWRALGRRTSTLRVSHAFHSVLMDPMLAPFREVAAELVYHAPSIPLLSNVTGRAVSAELVCDPEYWVRQVRSTVRFADGVGELAAAGVGTFLEVGPDAVLAAMARETLTGGQPVISLLRAGRDEVSALTEAVGRAHGHGVGVDWAAALAGGRRVDLPTYAFQHRGYWLDGADLRAEVLPAEDVSVTGTESTVVRDRRAQTLSGAEALPDAVAPVAGPGSAVVRDPLGTVLAHTAAVLGMAPGERLDPDATFDDLGFDSHMVVELSDRLAAATGRAVTTTDLFNHATPAALISHLIADGVGGLGAGHVAAEGVGTGGAPVPGSGSDADDPIVVVGMSCRFPGAVSSPEELWDLVVGEVDAVSSFPADRGWDPALVHPDPDHAGTSYVGAGGFLADVAGFDAEFFGISPREAVAMDPQQRLLLEVAWEALERAGIDPESLRGSRTGVFVGAGAADYGLRLHEAGDGQLLTGSSISVLSGRIAYVLGLQGQAITVDTACSSSLVALHLAARALRAGECSLALAAGVTVLATPGMFVEFSRQRGLAPDGRCKAFAAAADGTSWSEGAGVVVLERLSAARRGGHRVLAVVRGSAVNSDGASNGLTAPNGLAQQRVVRAALADAGVGASEVDAVEAHGTGTRLGDPIEAQALLATYGQRSGAPLWLGSLKSNIGHTQAAAGIAGVIKMVQAMQHGMLPRTLHVDSPTPQVDWDTGRVRLLTEQVPWPEQDRPRRAGVSSFGISGTNAHVILEQAPVVVAAGASGSDVVPGLLSSAEPRPDVEQAAAAVAEDSAGMPGSGVLPWVISGRSADALGAQAARLLSFVEARPGVDPAAVGRSLAVTRAGLRYRAAVVGGGRDELVAGLRSIVDGVPGAGVVSGVAVARPRPVFVFPGQGSQWTGMGVELMGSSPVFAARLGECAKALASFVDWDLFEVLSDEKALARVDVVQPVLWAVMVSLAELWRSYGVEPAAVVGHSQGEIAAACVAGGLSLDDGARVVALRSRAILALSGKGGMVSVAEPVGAVRERIARWGPALSVAAVNGPVSTVVSGEPAALAGLLALCETNDVRARRIPVDYASHSVQVEAIRTELLEVLAPITPVPGSVPFYSTVTGGLVDPAGSVPFDSAVAGELVDTAGLDAEYWYRNLRQTVHFEPVVAELAAAGHQVFVECSPHPVLAAGIQETAEDVAVVGSLRRDDGGSRRYLLSLTEAHVNGVDLDWDALLPGAPIVDLPTYAFQHQRFWHDIPRRAVEPGRYETVWRPVEFDADPAPVPGRWAIVVPAGSALPDAVVAAFTDAVAAEPVAARTEPVIVTVEPGTGREAFAALLAGYGDLAGVLALVPAGGGRAGLADTLTLLQAMADRDIAPLWCATVGAVSVGGERLDDPSGALVWGLGRVAALEQPLRWGGLVDLPGQLDAGTTRALRAVLAGVGEDQVAIRHGRLHGRRIVPARPVDGTPWTPTGTVLVTGGTGALGRETACWLARLGAPHLLLTSRSGAEAPGSAELIAELTALGAEVTIAACDVADRAALAELLATVPVGRPLTAVFHTAATLDDGMIDTLDRDRITAVLRAKVDGALALHEITGPLEAFVLFSSFAGTLGAPGLGNYAPGNAFLDALAEQRRADGLAATAIAWGPWAGAGMATGPIGERFRRHGLGELHVAAATAALGRELARGRAAAMIADLDWELFGRAFTADRDSRLLDELPVMRARSADPAPVPRLLDLPAAERDRALLDLVRTSAAAVLGHSGVGAIERSRSFKELGFDSMTGLELRNRLTTATGERLPSSLVFDHPTPAALAEHLGARLFGESRAEPVTRTVAAAGEPIAIVAMACRYPGGIDSPDDLWSLVEAGGEVITGLPADRGWDLAGLYHPDPDHLGTSYTRHGAFLTGAADFDSAFFGISPREALVMDPQQRVLLEICWELFERAGIDPISLRGSRTGVFAGLAHQQYAAGLAELPDGVEGFRVTGGATSVASGRIAYTFGLRGPALTVDTACSSSLVALHLAVRALRGGECDLAIAGGVTIMPSPQLLVEFSRQRGLSADGRCRAFAAAADGFGMGEGAGVLLVERLSEAHRKGHRVLAVVRGTAMNSDGASNGLTAPSGTAQRRVIEEALADAGLDPAAVDVVEAHGTGTRLGDPIEAGALTAAYGRDRRRPLLLGSVKSNLGHPQAAAGVAGVIKTVAAMRNGVVPATLHVDRPSPHVDWSTGVLALATEATPWPDSDHPRRAGVSSFGVSGTNAHVIVEQVAEPATESASAGAVLGQVAERRIEPGSGGAVLQPVAEQGIEPGTGSGPERVVPWLVSARGSDALRAQAARLAAALDPRANPVDIGRSLATTRATLSHRAVVLGRDTAELLLGLELVAAGDPGAVTGVAGEPGPVFVFPGQGSQWTGMAVDLMAAAPAFADSMGECAAALSPFVDWALADVLADEDALARVDVVQPALWAVMVSLAALWRAHGVEPVAVVGHSQGEIAAACVAGGLSLDDGARVVALRARALVALSGYGGMVSVAEPAAAVAERISDWGERLSVAAVNGPVSTVVSGEPAALDELVAACELVGVRARRIPVDYASHSAQVETIRAELLAAMADIRPRTGTVPFYSTVTGGRLDTATLDAGYWYENLRRTVQFDAVAAELVRQGSTVFVECAPHPVLTVGLRERFDSDGVTAAVVGSLRRDDGGWDRFLRSLSEACVHGVEPDWATVFPAGRTVDLPTYAFQRERYWLAGPAEPGARPTGPADVESLCYRIAWRPIAEPPATRLSGRWLLVVPAGAERLGASVASALREHGATVRLTSLDDIAATAESAAEPSVLADGAGVQAISLNGVAAAIVEPGAEPFAGVVSLLALDGSAHPEFPALSRGLADTLSLATAVAGAAPLWCLTTGAEYDGRQAEVWGLGRVLALEQPEWWGGLVDLPPDPDRVALRRMCAALNGDEDQVAVRADGPYGRRIVRAEPSGDGWVPRDTVLVTGASGSLGGHVARWLARSGARHLVLVSRRGSDAPGMPELVADLTAMGVASTVAACDVTDRAGLAALVDRVRRDAPPVRAVVHAAATIELGRLADAGPAELAANLAAKVLGAEYLDELFADDPLDAFVLFSSIAAFWGSGDHGGYAAANAHLDALARRRRARGVPATSIAWSVWDATNDFDREHAARRGAKNAGAAQHGLPLLSPDLGFEAMRRVVAGDEPVVAVADVDWPRFAELFTMARPSRLLAELPEVTAASDENDSGATPFTRELDAAPPHEAERVVLDLVRRQAAGVLGLRSVDEIGRTRPFRELGFDSLTAVDLRNRLTAATGVRLAATVVFERPTPAALAAHLHAELRPPEALGDLPVLTELDRLEAALAGAEPDRGTREQITQRLTTLLRRWRAGSGNGAGGVPAEFESATADDMFALIDKQFGSL